jgi:hypothetical protein
MIRAAVAAAAIGALLSATAASASGPLALETQQTGTYCLLKPTQLDQTVPFVVNSLGVVVSDTPPIAILDTGVDGSAPELAGRIVSPFDALSATEDGSDVDGHGTMVAGLAAADPGLVRGVAPTGLIMPIRIFNRYGDSTAKALVTGIKWAVAHGASVINLSASSPLSDVSASDVAAVRQATSDAFNRGVLVVAAVGNDGEQRADFPSSLPHVLAVGASDTDGGRAAFSDTGPWLDLVAPGVSLQAPTASSFCASGYGLANGASFGAPAVAAAAALLAKLRPDLTALERFTILRASAKDRGLAGRDDDTGFGLLDVASAIELTAPAGFASPEVDDDPYFVRGANQKGHPVRLASARVATVTGEVSPAKDPSDVYPVKLKKGERFVASAKVTGTDNVVEIGLWKPSVGDFDVSNEKAGSRVVSTGGFANDPQLIYRVKKSGTYYVSVEAPDVIDEDDPDAIPPMVEAYKLSLSRKKLAVRKPAPKKKKPARKN